VDNNVVINNFIYLNNGLMVEDLFLAWKGKEVKGLTFKFAP
jgi:hypothetical protein